VSNTTDIKPCPNCDTAVSKEIYYSHYTAVQCQFCKFKASLYFWQALPRRAEFHAELVEVVELWDDYDQNDPWPVALGERLRGLAKKYAPAKPEEVEG